MLNTTIRHIALPSLLLATSLSLIACDQSKPNDAPQTPETTVVVGEQPADAPTVEVIEEEPPGLTDATRLEAKAEFEIEAKTEITDENVQAEADALAREIEAELAAE